MRWSMYNFTTIKCSSCGAVIYNLPELEAKSLENFTLKCEDCSYVKISKDFEIGDNNSSNLTTQFLS